MKPAIALIVTAGLILSACTSGSSVTQQYAQPGDIVGPGSSFATQDVKRFVLVNGTTGLKDQTIEWRRSDDGQTMYITQNNQTFVLNWVPSATDPNVGAYYGPNSFYVNVVVMSDVVRAAYFSYSSGTGYFNGGHFVVGYKTDPSQISVANLGGSATYNGESFLSFRTDTQDAFGSGTVALNANFATQTVTGTMNITDRPAIGSDFVLPDTTITINPGNIANISGNQFITDLGIAVSTAGGDVTTIAQTGLNGNFYGVNAASLGAAYWATGTFNGQPLFIEGALASD